LVSAYSIFLDVTKNVHEEKKPNHFLNLSEFLQKKSCVCKNSYVITNNSTGNKSFRRPKVVLWFWNQLARAIIFSIDPSWRKLSPSETFQVRKQFFHKLLHSETFEFIVAHLKAKPSFSQFF
jgi:hypothetical protein